MRGRRFALAGFLAASVVCAAFFFSGGVGTLDGDPEELAERREISDDAINVLAVGTDERPDGESEGMGVRADAILIARVFPESGEVRVLSIPRDLFIQISPGVEDRVNAAYASGGVEQTVWAVEEYAGVKIDKRAVVDFEGFEEVVDAMGGVEVEVGDDVAPARLEEGRQTLDGGDVLIYARYRGTSGGDLDRTERQQEILAALRSQAFEPGSVTRLPELARVAGENISADLDFETSVALGKTVLERGDAPLKTGRLAGEPTTLSDRREVLIPDEEANQRVIEDFLR